MRRIIVFLIFILFCFTTVSNALNYDAEYYRNHRQSIGAVNKNADPIYLFMLETGNLVGGNRGTGNFYYVDTNVTYEGDGKSMTRAKDTLQEAVDLCTADNGDVICVAQGTAETIASSGALTLNKAGITIYFCGEGDQRGTYTVSTAATAKILVTADDVYIYNGIFQSGKTDLATVFLVTADDFTLDSCVLRDSTSGLGMITIGAADGDSDRFCIKNCDFYQPGTTNDHSIEVLFDMVGGRIINNVFHGDYDEGAIAIPAGGNACLDLVIAGNVITELQASIYAININGTSTTGVIAYNAVNSTDAYECDPGACVELVNSWQMDIDLTTNNLDHLMKVAVANGDDLTAEVVDGTVLSNILDDDGDTSAYDRTKHSLFAIGSDTDTLVSGVINGSGAALPTNKSLFDIMGDEYTDDGGNDNADSIAAHLNLISKYIADGDGDFAAGTALPSNKSMYNILGAYTADGGADDEDTIMAHLDLIYVDSQVIVADTEAMDTAAEMAALVDANSILYDAPRITIATTGNFSGTDYETGDSPVTIFTVTGDIKCRCSAVIGTGCTSVNNDGTLELGITGDTACLLIQDVVDGTAFAAGDAWTLIDEPDDGSAQENDEWVIVGGGNDIILTIATDNMSTGIVKFYLQWIPLSANAAVVAAAP